MLSYGDYWHQPTRKAVAELIKNKRIPKAIICANDSMAITACEELESHNISVPDDVIVTGFDGIKEVEYCTPPLTTCKYNLPLFIEKIVYYIDTAIKGNDVSGIYNIDFAPIIYSSCGCHSHYRRKNFGGLLKKSEDRFNGYRENERTLHELLENSVMCDTSAEITELLKKFNFGNIFIAINKNCFNSAVNPVNELKSGIFDDKLFLAYPAVSDSLPREYGKPEIIDLLNNFMDTSNPIVFTALGFMGMPFGFIAGNTEVTFEEYSRIQQCANAINTLIGCNRNVRYIKYASKQIEKMSKLDYLTGLYNRSGFYSSLNKITDSAFTSGKHIAVVSIDADRLKFVNDTYGHNSGDFIILTAAQAMNSISFTEKICGRFGGDELAACIVFDDTEKAEQTIKSDINNYLDRLNKTSDKPFDVSVSIGVTICTPDNFDFDSAYRTADKKMYEDKKSKGVNRNK